jgi:hypothetical protein
VTTTMTPERRKALEDAALWTLGVRGPMSPLSLHSTLRGTKSECSLAEMNMVLRRLVSSGEVWDRLGTLSGSLQPRINQGISAPPA